MFFCHNDNGSIDVTNIVLPRQTTRDFERIFTARYDFGTKRCIYCHGKMMRVLTTVQVAEDVKFS